MSAWTVGTVAVQWVPGEGTRMVGRDSRGRTLVLSRGQPWEDDQEWLGLKASDLLLLSAAGCATYDLVTILRRQRQPVRHVLVRCHGHQENEPPFRFHKIEMEYHVYGPVDEGKVARAVELLENRYCSVIVTLKAAVEISSRWVLHP